MRFYTPTHLDQSAALLDLTYTAAIDHACSLHGHLLPLHVQESRECLLIVGLVLITAAQESTNCDVIIRSGNAPKTGNFSSINYPRVSSFLCCRFAVESTVTLLQVSLFPTELP